MEQDGVISLNEWCWVLGNMPCRMMLILPDRRWGSIIMLWASEWDDTILPERWWSSRIMVRAKEWWDEIWMPSFQRDDETVESCWALENNGWREMLPFKMDETDSSIMLNTREYAMKSDVYPSWWMGGKVLSCWELEMNEMRHDVILPERWDRWSEMSHDDVISLDGARWVR